MAPWSLQSVFKVIRQPCVGFENYSQIREQQHAMDASCVAGLRPCSLLEKPQKRGQCEPQ